MVWTTIPDSDIDPDSPITTGLMTAYRDNFAALAEGLSGAPLIHPSSALDDTITTNGTQSIGTGVTWTTPQGFYNIVSYSGSAVVDLYVSAAWRNGLTRFTGALLADGTNMRMRGISAGTVAWQRFDG